FCNAAVQFVTRARECDTSVSTGTGNNIRLPSEVMYTGVSQSLGLFGRAGRGLPPNRMCDSPISNFDPCAWTLTLINVRSELMYAISFPPLSHCGAPAPSEVICRLTPGEGKEVTYSSYRPLSSDVKASHLPSGDIVPVISLAGVTMNG